MSQQWQSGLSLVRRSGNMRMCACRGLSEDRDIRLISADTCPSYTVGQSVWLSTRNLKLKLPCRKLCPKLIGPFTIVRQINPVCFRLHLPASYRICLTFHVSLLKPAYSCHGALPACEPPSPLNVDRSPAYSVSAPLNSRCVRSHLQYLVNWEGYGPKECSWVDTVGALSYHLQGLVMRGSPRPNSNPLPFPLRHKSTVLFFSSHFPHSSAVQCTPSLSYVHSPHL